MGPLAGIKIVEIAGIGPGPFCAMMLADMGADVVRIDRPASSGGGMSVISTDERKQVLNRGRRSAVVDLKHPDGVATVLRIVERADALIEGFRPGVMERLGLGPEACLARNAHLVYGRMTGWGQDGPLAHTAGHDVNYIALAGALDSFRRAGEKPTPPVNLVGDFGGGGLLLAFGIACALVDASRSGIGQIVDAAMVDGAAVLMSMMYGLYAQGAWTDVAGTNMLDTGAPFYEVYETADGRFVSVGALEEPFYQALVKGLGVDDLPPRFDMTQWPALRARLTEIFKTKTRDEWGEIFYGSDACVMPVYTMTEAPKQPHNVARGTFVERDGITQPAPAPRFSRTSPEPGALPPEPGEHTDEVLSQYGFDSAEIERLRESGAIA